MLTYNGGRAEKMALGIITLYVLVSLPIRTEFNPDSWFDSIEVDEGKTDSSYGQVIEDAYEEGIARGIADKFSLDPADVRVIVRGFDISSLTAKSSVVILRGKAIVADPISVKKYVEDISNGECNVEIEIG